MAMVELDDKKIDFQFHIRTLNITGYHSGTIENICFILFNF